MCFSSYVQTKLITTSPPSRPSKTKQNTTNKLRKQTTRHTHNTTPFPWPHKHLKIQVLATWQALHLVWPNSPPLVPNLPLFKLHWSQHGLHCEVNCFRIFRTVTCHSHESACQRGGSPRTGPVEDVDSGDQAGLKFYKCLWSGRQQGVNRRPYNSISSRNCHHPGNSLKEDFGMHSSRQCI